MLHGDRRAAPTSGSEPPSKDAPSTTPKHSEVVSAQPTQRRVRWITPTTQTIGVCRASTPSLTSIMPTTDQLRAAIRRLPAHQQTRFSKRLSGARRVDDPDRRSQILNKIGSDLETFERRRALRANSIPERLVYPDLPITDRHDDLLASSPLYRTLFGSSHAVAAPRAA